MTRKSTVLKSNFTFGVPGEFLDTFNHYAEKSGFTKTEFFGKLLENWILHNDMSVQPKPEFKKSPTTEMADY
jgi:Zn-dependent M16 (insulinase) family peptidase